MAPSGTTRARARRRRGRAAHSIASATARIVRAAVEVDEEHVGAEPSPARPRLDAGEVDLAVGELGQAAHEPARRGRRSAPRTSARSSTRRPRRGVRRLAARSTRSASRARAGPRRPTRAPRSRRARPPRGCRSRPTARPPLALGDEPHRVGGRGGGRPPRRPASRVRRNVAHWPLRLRVRGDRGDALERARRSRAIRQWWIGCTSSPAIWTSSVSNASASSVALTEPSSEFSIGTSARSTRPSWTAITASWTDRQRHRLEFSVARPGQHRLLAVGPGRAEEADPHPCSVAAPSPASARRTASTSSGESSSSPRPSTTDLQ